jgi:phosphate transport system protein
MADTHAARSQFTELLEDLDDRLLRLGGEAHELLSAALDAYLSSRIDTALIDRIRTADAEIDRAYLVLEREAQSVLARHAPVSGDLRRVLAVLQAALHVERIGDTAVDVVEAAGTVPPELREDLAEMGHVVLAMIDLALTAFHARDRQAVERLPAMDDRVDDLHAALLARVRSEAGIPASHAVAAFQVSRLLERAGDHAVDIGEQAWFLATGELRELNGPTHRRN